MAEDFRRQFRSLIRMIALKRQSDARDQRTAPTPAPKKEDDRGSS